MKLTLPLLVPARNLWAGEKHLRAGRKSLWAGTDSLSPASGAFEINWLPEKSAEAQKKRKHALKYCRVWQPNQKAQPNQKDYPTLADLAANLIEPTKRGPIFWRPNQKAQPNQKDHATLEKPKLDSYADTWPTYGSICLVLYHAFSGKGRPSQAPRPALYCASEAAAAAVYALFADTKKCAECGAPINPQAAHGKRKFCGERCSNLNRQHRFQQTKRNSSRRTVKR
jgi:hypothetical protein